jgi:hypothetical protein
MSCYSESKSNQKLNPDNRGSHLKKSTANITLKLANNNRKKRIINNKSEPPLVNINHHITTRKIRSKQQQPPPPPPLPVTVATCEIYNKNNETQTSTTNSFKLDLDQTIESTTSQQQQQQPPPPQQQQQQQLNQTSSTRPSSVLSDIETAILKSTMPIQIDETDEITVNGEHGIWANKSEVINWKGGDIPLSEYEVNEDSQPELINKKIHQHLEYIQELAIRYLKPPTPPPPGEIVIKQDPNQWIPPAPPLIIRQQPPRPATPEPLVIRELPPPPPPLIGRKLIKISGKKLPPPPRKVIIERLAPLPSKPQSVIIERWLPYNDKLKRKVIFTRTNRGADGSSDPVVLKPKNIIVQWEPPSVVVKQDFRYLGTIKANPVEYVQRYGDSLKSPDELPYFIKEMKTPDGIVLASDYTRRQVPELEGDLEALKYIDLDEEGLSEYKPQLEQHKQQKEEQKQLQNNSITNIVVSPSNSSCCSIGASYTVSTAISEIFSQIDTDNDGKITCDEASKILFRLNNRLINNYDETELVSLITARSTYGNINLYDFKRIFEKMLV